MPPFFRTASEISESEDVTVSDSADLSQSQLIEHDAAREELGAGLANLHHQNVLFHALLEDKCLNDVYHEISTASPRSCSRDDPEIRARAAERYRLLTGRLVSHGLAQAGLEQRRFDHVRQTAREGLTLLSQQLDALDLSGEASAGSEQRQVIRQPFRRLLTDVPTHVGMGAPSSVMPDFVGFNPTLASHILPSHPLLDSARYVRDFEEIGILGKGGYGTVFHVNHRLDGRSYAVKKIALGASAILRVQQRGESELEDILLEIRTLARLEHCNIVRYFGGWVEWSAPMTPSSRSRTDHMRLLTQGSADGTTTTQSSSEDSGQSLSHRVLYQESLSDQGVFFEESNPVPTMQSNRSLGSQPPSRTTLVTVSDDEIEVVERHDPPSSSTPLHEPPMTAASLSSDLTLHIQMSLYPLTLSQYLGGSDLVLDGKTVRLQHCFHLDSSADLMLAILDGVDYLHQNGIVHRDLKPANIFLSPRYCATDRRVPSGTIDPADCRSCTTRSTHARAEAPARQSLRMGVCVGDFGLVSMLRRKESVASDDSIGAAVVAQGDQARQVGTALYRPAKTGALHEGLDIYALGIILVELLVRFDTRMERVVALSALRERKVPEGLDEQLCKLLGDMLDAGQEQGDMRCEEVRRRLMAMVAAVA